MRIITSLLSTLGDYVRRIYHWCWAEVWRRTVLAVFLGLVIGYIANGIGWPKFYQNPSVSLSTLDICKAPVN
jgi:hypothetical protein|tara:strand:+ start:352 stop:567 length:216 start_codon:yes stop_codon:yes gene_type:complete